MITKVRESSGHIASFDKQRIVSSLLKESKLIWKLNGHKKLTVKEANFIADDVEKLIDEHNIKYLSAPLIREIACASMLKHEMEEVRRIYTRVGIPIYDLFSIITNPEIENANLVDNAETAHKYVADKVLKEGALLLLPRHISEAHLGGDIHIHDLEYFLTRPFCYDHDLRNFFFYGFDPSGINKTNIAGPAKNAEVAILHATKILGASQNSFSIDALEDVIISKKGIMTIEKIGDVVDSIMENRVTTSIPEINGEYLDISDLDIKSIAFNPDTYQNDIRTINKVIRHKFIDNLFEITTKSGRSVKTTGSHSVFKFVNGIPYETLVNDLKPSDELVIPSTLPPPMLIKGINLIEELSLLDKSVIEDIFVVGSKYKLIDHSRQTYNWRKRDSIPLTYIIENSIKIDAKTCFLRVSRSDKKIPAYILLTSDFYRLLGYFVSEGHITQNNCVGFSFGIEKKSECIVDVEDILKSMFGFDVQKTLHNESTIQVVVNSKLLCILLKYIFNTGTRAIEKRVPKYVFNATKENKIQFLKGYFCDGYSRRREISFKTASRKLSSDISYLLLQLGIVPVIDEGMSREREFNGKILSESKYYQITIYGRENIEFLTPILGSRNNLDKYKTNTIYPNKENKITIGDLCSDTIVSIKRVRPTSEYVYDLSIDGYENFIGGHGGIALHNSGGQGYYNFLTFLSPYLKGKTEKEIRQLIQMFLYEMTQTMISRGSQTTFSSIQLTPGVPNLWKNKPSVYAGEVHPNEPYGNFEKEVRIAFKVLMELMIEGDYNGKPFNFPKPEIGFMKEFLVPKEQDKFYGTDIPTYDELYDKVFELTAKFGTPYFDNMIAPYRNKEEDSVACVQCCAYNFGTSQSNDTSFNNKLYFKDHIGFSMGAWQVITINCPRLAYKSTTSEDFIQSWKQMVDLAVEVFKEKKKFMDIQIAANRIPFAQQKPRNHKYQSKHSLVDFDKLVWEIGIIGLDDVVRYFTTKSMHESVDSFELAQYLCLEMKQIVDKKSKETGMRLALSRTPAETTAQRFAVSDLINPLYTDSAREIVSGDLAHALELLSKTKNLPVYYTNGTHVPVSADCTLIDRLRIEEDFFDILDGGNIHHIFIAEHSPDPKGLKEFVMNIIKKTKIGYFAFTKVLTACNDCSHVEPGKHLSCFQCGSTKIDYISRITGYLSNLKSWNAAKQEEFKNRREYDLMR